MACFAVKGWAYETTSFLPSSLPLPSSSNPLQVQPIISPVNLPFHYPPPTFSRKTENWKPKGKIQRNPKLQKPWGPCISLHQPHTFQSVILVYHSQMAPLSCVSQFHFIQFSLLNIHSLFYNLTLIQTHRAMHMEEKKKTQMP